MATVPPGSEARHDSGGRSHGLVDAPLAGSRPDLPRGGQSPRGPATPPVTGPRRRLPRWVLVSAGVALLLGAGAVIGIPLLVERYGLRAVAAVERRLGVRLTAREVDWSWSGQARIEGLGVQTADGRPIATAARVEIDASVDLIERTLALKRIALQDAALAVTLAADGTSNFDSVLAGLRQGGDEPAGDGASGASRMLRGAPPVVRVDGARVVLDIAPSRLPPGLALPPQVGFSQGRVEATPQTGDEEGYGKAVWDVRVAFGDTTLDPGFGFGVSVMAGLEAGLGRVGLTFARPVRVRLGSRVAAVGGLGYDGGQAMVVAEAVQLSQPVPDGPAPASVDAALSLGRVTFGPVDATRLLRAGLGQAAGGPGVGGLLRSLLADAGEAGLLTVTAPVAVLDLATPWLGFADLAALAGLSEAGAGPEGAAPPDAKGKGSKADKAHRKDEPRPIREALAGAVDRLRARIGDVTERLHARLEAELGRLPRVVVTEGRLELRGHGAAVALTDLGLEAGREEGGPRVRVAARVGPPSGQAAPAASAPKADEASGDPRGSIALELADLAQGEGGGRILTASLEARGLLGAWFVPVLGPPGAAEGPAPSGLAAPGAEVTIAADGQVAALRGAMTVVTGAPEGPGLVSWEVDGRLSASGLTVRVPGLSDAPLAGLDGLLEGRLRDVVKDDILSVEGLRVGRRGVEVTGQVDVASASRTPRLKLALKLPQVEVQKLFDAIPEALVPALRGLRVRGTLAWDLAVDLDTGRVAALKDSGLVSNPVLTDFALESMGEVIDFNALRRQHTYQVRAADGAMTTRLVGPEASGWVPFGSISPWLGKALNTTEDGTFWSNDGVAPFAMRESLVANLERGAFVRGGSTITQQLVKNLYLGGQKQLARKAVELFVAWQMTKAMEKREILELYLNTIEFAPGVYGVGAAAYHWFGRGAGDLTLPEAVFLASIVPSPRRYHGFYAAGGVSPKWQDYVRSLIAIMVKRGHVTQEEVEALGDWQLVFRSTPRGEDGTPLGAAGREKVYDQLPEPDGGEDWDGDILNQPR